TGAGGRRNDRGRRRAACASTASARACLRAGGPRRGAQMTVALDPAAPATTVLPTPVAPTQYVVPRVHGDPAAARALAAAYRELADDVSAAARLSAGVMAGLSGSWAGHGHRAATHP